MDKVKQMSEAVLDGRPRDALAIFDGLPDSLKHDKVVLLVRLRTVQALDDDEACTKAIAEMHALFPDDPNTDLLSIDYYFLKKMTKEALEAIDRLDKSVGGDPYLDVLRANTHFQSGDLATAREDAERAVKREATLIEGYWTLVTISLSEERYDDTAALLDTLRDRFHVTFQDLSKMPAYKGFVASPQYRAWLEAQPKPKSDAPDTEEKATP